MLHLKPTFDEYTRHARDATGANPDTIAGQLLIANRSDARDQVLRAVGQHLTGSHLSFTYPDGSTGRHEVRWEADQERYCDNGNNLWLYRREGDDGRDQWYIVDRNAHPSGLRWRMCEESRTMGRHAHNMPAVWAMYWSMLLEDRMRYTHEPGVTIQLHLEPWKEPARD